jgi:hypothetical protein
MKNRNLLIGGAVLIGILLYLRNRNKTNETANDDLRSEDAGGGGKALAKENGGGAIMDTTQPVVVAQPKRQPPKISKPLFGRINVGGTTILNTPKPSTGTGIMSPTNLQDAIDRAKGRSNFLTFDGNDEQSSGLDFDGNIVD